MEGKEIPLLEIRNVSKEFNKNSVLKDINFTIERGQVVGLVGENGAGKSTLMNILFGMSVIRDTGGYGGQIIFEGKEVVFNSPLDAINSGIGMVHQEFSLLPDFTATENILLNREPEKKSVLSYVFSSRTNTIDRVKMQKEALAAITKLGVEIDQNMYISAMPVGHKQFTEISRELSKSSIKLLVLDEPTAVLSEKEAEMLLVAIKNLSKSGISVIFITHRLQEILDVCDKVIVMRDGLVVDEKNTNETSIRNMARLMVGRDVEIRGQEALGDKEKTEVIMSIRGLSVSMPGERVKSVNLDIFKGEILGIGGLAGQGKIGIPNGIMGLYEAKGEVVFKGRPLSLNNPKGCLNQNIAFVSEDRRTVGLLLDESLEWNITFTAMQVQNKFLKKYLSFIKWRDQKAIKDITNKYIDSLQIKCISTVQKARELSGGNQQKICLAKAFVLEPELLFVSEPTRGIDIGAKSLVLDALRKYNEELGVTIVVISSELEELRALSERIAIVSDGEISGILPSTVSAEEFGLLMAGEKRREA